MMDKEEFGTPEGRRRAWLSLMLHDHGFLRKLYNNTHDLGGGMYRTYQPSPATLEQWAEKGLKTVINLRGIRDEPKQDGLYYLEEETCARLGIEMINFRAYSREAPTRDFIFGIKELFERIEYPAIMHCKSGADRAGIASTLYQFLYVGKSLEESLEQLSFRYGHIREGKTGILDYFFDLYKEATVAEGVTPNEAHFLNWVDTEYEQEKIKPAFKPTPLGTLLTEKILRRE